MTESTWTRRELPLPLAVRPAQGRPCRPGTGPGVDRTALADVVVARGR